MEEKTFKVPAIGCDGCVKAIKGEIGDMAGVVSVDGSVDSKMVTVKWDAPADWTAIKNTLVEIEYAPEEA